MIPNIYKGDYKKLIILPLILIILGLYFATHIKLGVDFKSGTLITLVLNEKINPTEVESFLRGEGFDVRVRFYETAVGYQAEMEFTQPEELTKADETKERFNSLLEEVAKLEASLHRNLSSDELANNKKEYQEKKKELNKLADEIFAMAGIDNRSSDFNNLNLLSKAFSDAYNKIYSDYRKEMISAIRKKVDYSSIVIKTISPLLSAKFLENAVKVFLFSAILSTIFVFLFFRTFVPSLAVLIGASSDVIFALGAMGLFGIPLTLPSFAALLMLIGFSLDTDILLTMRMLKRKGNPREKAFDSMKTGMTMSLMAIVSFSVLFILSVLTRISTYYEISAVALAGLFGDLIATWCLNAVIILDYVERRGI